MDKGSACNRPFIHKQDRLAHFTAHLRQFTTNVSMGPSVYLVECAVQYEELRIQGPRRRQRGSPDFATGKGFRRSVLIPGETDEPQGPLDTAFDVNPVQKQATWTEG